MSTAATPGAIFDAKLTSAREPCPRIFAFLLAQTEDRRQERQIVALTRRGTGDVGAVEPLAQIAPLAVLQEREEHRRVEGDVPRSGAVFALSRRRQERGREPRDLLLGAQHHGERLRLVEHVVHEASR